MTYAIVDVKGGGVFLKRRDGASHDKPLHDKMVTEVDPDSPFGNHRVSLVQKSALRGMLMRLCGMTSSVKLFESSEDGSEARKILETIYAMLSRARIVTNQIPHIHNVFFDSFNEKGDRKFVDSVNLRSFEWNDSNRVVSFLKEELVAVTGHNSLAGCYDEFVSSREKKDFVVLNGSELDSIPNLAFETSIGANFRETLLKYQQSDGKVFRLFRDLALACIRRLSTDADYRRQAEQAGKMVSIFLPNGLNQNRHWVHRSRQTIVRGVPEFIAKVDWELVIPSLDEEEISFLERGPKCASWAENGVARLRIEYSGDAIDGISDNPHVTVRDMNLGGFKIRTTQDEKVAHAAEAKERQAKRSQVKKKSTRTVARL